MALANDPPLEERAQRQRPRASAAERIGRLDLDPVLRARLLPLCRLGPGEVWTDSVRGHRVGVLDAAQPDQVEALMAGERTGLLIADPPYNLVLGGRPSGALPRRALADYLAFSAAWIGNAVGCLKADAHFYLWLGADVKHGFQPLPDVMLLLRGFPALRPRNLITLRNQRGFGTGSNWMWVRQELLYYVKGNPPFDPAADVTEIPKILRGYYKEVGGRLTENRERGRSPFIRAGNVWVDIQQVFYRLRENVPGCYAQKPLKAIERLLLSGIAAGDLVVDFFAHSGTTLVAGERLGKRVYTLDDDPIFAEITIRRLERLRATGETGWQWHSPFPEIAGPEGGREHRPFRGAGRVLARVRAPARPPPRNRARP